ncbi:MAG: DUF1592 domain-containing protein [Deltaproteobacteria bacterium]|nr:DUF1592 domain-containing protein [Deltaproteobacteria bacterium]
MHRDLSMTVLVALLVGCVGDIGEPRTSGPGGRPRPGVPGSPGSVPDVPRTPDGMAICSGGPHVGATPLRRLTRAEYDHTVRDLVGDTTSPARGFTVDETPGGFHANTVAPVAGLAVEQYQTAAEGIASRVNVDAIVACDRAADGEETCARRFIERFALRAFRRPAEPAELTAITALYDGARAAGDDFATAVRLVVEAVLQTPSFLYRQELGAGEVSGTGGTMLRLSGYEVASRLSYFLWQSMPDDDLFAAAAANELTTPAQIEPHVRRMLEDDRAREAVRDFNAQWLELEALDSVTKDPDVYPEFDATLASSMRAETERFLDHVVWEGDRTLRTVLTGNFTFVDGPLAELYGLDAPAGGGLVRVALDAGERSGILTHASLLSTHAKTNQSSPIHRGKFVRERLLCQALPAPPPGLMVVAPDPAPGLTTRQRFAEHSSNEDCATCHRLMDPIGFGFERYDGIGRFRTTDQGLPVDDSGEILGGTDVDGPFRGAPELAQRLAESTQVSECFATQWTRFAIGRADGPADDCVLADVAERFDTAGGDIRELIVAVATSDAFLYRPAYEVAP